MLLTYFELPRVASVFNLYATRVEGLGQIEWSIDDNLIKTTEEQKWEFDDRLFIQPAWAGKELHVIGTDRFTRTEVRLQIAGATIEPSPRPADKVPEKFPPADFVVRPPDKVPEKPRTPGLVVPPPGTVPKKFPKICAIMLRSPDITFRRPDGSFVHLHHTGTRNSPSDIHVKNKGRRIGTIKSDGSVSAEPEFSLEDLIDLLEEFGLDPQRAIREYGRETGTCGVCGRELTNPASIRRGIGPVCAGKVGGSILGALTGS